MEWKEIYNNKIITANEAVSKIKSGDKVVVAHACGEPTELLKAMVNNKKQYENVELIHMVAMGDADYAQSGMEKYFRHNSLFVGRMTREAVSSGRADFTPCFFSEIPQLFRDGFLSVDVALIQVSTPDENGNCSFGISVDYTKPAAECAKIVIAEVNAEMPRTFGDSFINVKDIDYIVETTHSLIELKIPKIGEIEKAIGGNCASLIKDGDTLQLGIGAIPDAVLLFLKGKKNLGIHSEMISDGVMELLKEGIITNKMKTLHPEKVVVSFIMGTKSLYKYVNNNPNIEMYPVDYVNNPAVIAKNDNIISINSCVQVDLMGQVCSESIGSTQISAVGGQVDFVRGAKMSKGGKSIIAMPSTANKGKKSKIIAELEKGDIVTTLRTDVDYIVTEYGVARLRGKTLRERAKALINIAHPDFRKDLVEFYEKRFNEKIN